jgi:hypothetical protein
MARRKHNTGAREWIVQRLDRIASRLSAPTPEPPPERPRHQLDVKSPPVVSRRRRAALSIEEATPAYPQVPAPSASRLQREALNWSPPCTLSAEELARMDAWARSDRSR